MTVWVDNAFIPFRGMLMSHLFSDNLNELHKMVDAIGVQRKWFQSPPQASFPHYDICKSKRQLAIENGAIPISYRGEFPGVVRKLEGSGCWVVKRKKIYLGEGRC